MSGDAVDTHPRLLSSRETFLMKVIFPALWTGGVGTVTLSVFLYPGSWYGAGGSALDPNARWTFLVVMIAGTVFIWWTCVRLKRVRMDDRVLYISNYMKEIVVPLRVVADVTENRWTNIHPVTLTFQSETEFGSRIVFMPKVRWLAFWSSHPVVGDLRSALARAKARGST